MANKIGREKVNERMVASPVGQTKTSIEFMRRSTIDAPTHIQSGCSINAIRHAYNLTEAIATRFMFAHGFVFGVGILPKDMENVYACLKGTKNVTHRFVSERKDYNGAKQGMKLSTALPLMKHGIFFVEVRGHVFCVKNGKIFDGFINGNMRINKVTEVTN